MKPPLKSGTCRAFKIRMASQRCACSAKPFFSLEHHWRRSPACKPVEAAHVAELPAPKQHKPSPDKALSSRLRTAESDLGQRVATMRLLNIMEVADIKESVDLALSICTHMDSILKEVTSEIDSGVAGKIMDAVASMAEVVRRCKDVDKQCKLHAPGAVTSIERPLLAKHDAAKKWFSFLSVQDVVVDLLRNDKDVRMATLKSSEKWKTGSFATTPKIASDLVHGKRFANSLLARKAGPNETRHVRVGLTLWNDDMTVRQRLFMRVTHVLNT